MLDNINNFIWLIASALIIFSGLYFSFSLRGVQFRLGKMYKSLFSDKNSKGIKPYQTLMMVLAGRIGVGSIAGVALAIHLGGLGAIFWMWITAFIGALRGLQMLLVK